MTGFVPMRIECETAAQCERLAELMVGSVEPVVFVMVATVVAVLAYQTASQYTANSEGEQ